MSLSGSMMLDDDLSSSLLVDDAKEESTVKDSVTQLTSVDYGSQDREMSQADAEEMDDAASFDSDDHSVFDAEVADTMELLRVACQNIDNADLALRSFEMLSRICKGRFYAKSRLTASGAADHAAVLFNRWKEDPIIVVIACEALSQFAGGETENKMALGLLHVCENLLVALDALRTDMSVVRACCQLITDLSNCVLKGLLKKYVGNRLMPAKLAAHRALNSTYAPPTKPDTSEDFLFSDNRKRFGDAGACALLTSILDELSAQDVGLQDSSVTTTITLCHAVGTLAANQDNCVAFGRAGIARPIVRMINDRFPVARVVAALWIVAVLCTDVATKNKQRFHEVHTCRAIVDYLYDIERCERDYRDEPLFNKLIEHLGWALLNVIVGNESSALAVKSISFAQQTFGNILAMESIKDEYKARLRQVQKKLYDTP